MDQSEAILLLKAMLEQQKEFIRLLETRLKEKDATIADLRKAVEELSSLKANLEETLAELRRQFFGVRSEKTSAKAKEILSETSREEPREIAVKAHTRERKKKATRDELYKNLPVREVMIPLSKEQKHCAYCGAAMTGFTYVPVREELRITPAKVERILYKQEVALCPVCRSDGDGTFEKSVVPTALMPHSPASPSAVAYVMFQKTFLGLPYYRLEGALLQLGLKLPRETMANWYIHCAEEYFYPIYDRMHESIVKLNILHADETTCQVLREKGRAAEATSYMWIYLTGSDGLPPIVMYDYQPGRGGKYPRGFLRISWTSPV